MLEVKNLDCGYENRIILNNISFKTSQGDIVCILGPNGSGKSTLIKAVVGLLKPFKGKVTVDSDDITILSWKERAKIISYIPQTFNSMFQYMAFDIVLMGRNPYLPLGVSPSKEDEEIAETAMGKLKILHLRDKIYSKLSGGERQLVKIAQALTQKTKIMVMDEPTNNLDFGYQMTMFNHIQKCADMGITIIMATHSPEQTFLYGTKALLVKGGKVIEVDKPNQCLTEKDLKDLYGAELTIMEFKLNNNIRKVCLPIF